MTLDEFIDRYTDPRWCDLEEFPQVAQAFQAMCDQIPDEDLRAAPRVHFFQISVRTLGHLHRRKPQAVVAAAPTSSNGKRYKMPPPWAWE